MQDETRHDTARQAVSEWLIINQQGYGEIDVGLWELLCRMEKFDKRARKVDALVLREGNKAAEKYTLFLELAHWVIGAKILQRARTPDTRKRGHYRSSLMKHCEVWSFLGIDRCKAIENRLFGTEYVIPKKDKEKHAAFLAAIDGATGRPYVWRPKNWDVFRKACDEAERIFGSEDGESVLGDVYNMPEFRKRMQPTPEQITQGILFMQREVAAIHEEWARHPLPPPREREYLDLETCYDKGWHVWPAVGGPDGDPLFGETAMLEYGARNDWPEHSFIARDETDRLHGWVKVNAGEESWRLFVSQMSPQDKGRFACIVLEERRLQDAYREKQDAKARKAAQESADEVEP